MRCDGAVDDSGVVGRDGRSADEEANGAALGRDLGVDLRLVDLCIEGKGDDGASTAPLVYTVPPPRAYG